ncbi:NADPH-dependent FMN reductase [Paractinoplanes lichenicola]|uniref:NAD(P)H-dependent oxidoreductase n=1 Tax=Paractinoplanes lichenicola TaxID=2802976 RepID=A0ABS1VPC1_9ACTN|nr:NAD(P)H-dependent oxidoreductase [Actinoplanes lichenicola]MBL7255989.1 NAD(P)H-dependent oxidoreductase [Actinoplanes lichenicola]
MMRIGIILGSTRPNRLGEQVAHWVLDLAARRSDAVFELLDLREHALPQLDEEVPPVVGQYQNEHTRNWAGTIAAYDGFVIVTPEYNHSVPGALKNALDYLYAEWGDKAMGIVSYGSVGGARAAEQLRQIAGALRMADVRQQVLFSLMTDFENFQTLQPKPFHESALETMLDQLLAWSGALTVLRRETVPVNA